MISGQAIAFVTFIGVIIHEWSHKKFCEWMKVPVFAVKYFQLGDPAGYVIHEEPKEYKKIFWISVGPIIINSLLTFFSGILASIVFDINIFLFLIIFYIGFSIGMHSFPSNKDAKNILNKSKKILNEDGSIVHYLSFPFVGLIYIANSLKFFWFDAIYATTLFILGNVVI